MMVDSLTVASEGPASAPMWWELACQGLDPIEACFGPEGHHPRPRDGEAYWTAWQDRHAVGLIWINRPAPTTATFGLGLFPDHRRRGLGAPLRDAALAIAFEDPAIWKAETEIYLSNERSLTVLHLKQGRMEEEGLQRETIQVGGEYYDRLLLGITRATWNNQEAAKR